MLSATGTNDTTPYQTDWEGGRGGGGDSGYVIHNLEVLGNILLKWFSENSIKANPDKYHLLLSSSDSSKITIGNKNNFQ